MLRGQRSRHTWSRLRLHHAATLFIAALAFAHLLITYWTIQYEEVWVGLSPGQKLLRAFKVLLVDAYKPRTRARSSSCQVADHIPKVRHFSSSVANRVMHRMHIAVLPLQRRDDQMEMGMRCSMQS